MLAMVLALAACGGDDGEAATPVEPGTCDGGGTLMVELGDGGRSDFAPFADGVELPIITSGGVVGLQTEYWTSGLDTTAGSMTVVARVSVDGGPTSDGIAQRNLLCDDEVGYGWDSIVVPVDDDVADDPDGAEGLPFVLTVVVTDANGTSATGEVSGVIGG